MDRHYGREVRGEGSGVVVERRIALLSLRSRWLPLHLGPAAEPDLEETSRRRLSSGTFPFGPPVLGVVWNGRLLHRVVGCRRQDDIRHDRIEGQPLASGGRAVVAASVSVVVIGRDEGKELRLT